LLSGVPGIVSTRLQQIIDKFFCHAFAKSKQYLNGSLIASSAPGAGAALHVKRVRNLAEDLHKG
jgi:hypothetical protein